MAISSSIPQNILFIALIVLAIVVFFLFVWNIFLGLSLRKIKRQSAEFFAGNKAKNLEEVILSHAKNLKTLDKDIQELFNISNQINTLALRGLNKTGLVRFNPFKDVGGDQSFAIALLNGKNNGLIISSLYTREGTRFYAKSIISGKSEKHPLTEEEEQTIKIALNSEPKKIT
jgi:hypothetical protein